MAGACEFAGACEYMWQVRESLAGACVVPIVERYQVALVLYGSGKHCSCISSLGFVRESIFAPAAALDPSIRCTCRLSWLSHIQPFSRLNMWTYICRVAR